MESSRQRTGGQDPERNVHHGEQSRRQPGQEAGLFFAPLLREALAKRELPAGVRSLTVLDLAAELGPEHWFVLDDHLRPSGHRLVGERLWEAMSP